MAKKRPQPKVSVCAHNNLIVSCGARAIWVTPKQARDLIDKLETALEPIELAAAFPEAAEDAAIREHTDKVIADLHRQGLYAR
jgi:hypothetical protein